MKRRDSASHDRVMKGMTVADDVLYWRKLTDGEESTKSGSVENGSTVQTASKYSSSSQICSDRRNFAKYSRRTRRSRVGSVEMTEELPKEMSVPDVISLLKGNSLSSNEDQFENRVFSALPQPREPHQVVPPLTLIEQPAAVPDQNVSGLRNYSSNARRLLRSPPVRDPLKESAAQPPDPPPEQSAPPAGESQASNVCGLNNSRSRLLRSPRVRVPQPLEEPPKVSAPAPLEERAVVLTGLTQHSKVSGLSNSKAPLPLWPLQATDLRQENSAASSLPIQNQSDNPPPPPPSKAPPPPPPLLPQRPPKAAESAAVSVLPPPPLPLRPSKRNDKCGEVSSSPSQGGSSQEGPAGAIDQVKLKPLHWEKVNVHTEHSMVWNNIDRGSFKVDGDLMEALFGSAATNEKPGDDSKANRPKPEPSSTKIFILEIRKSQNIAIILRSLGETHSEIMQSLNDGHGLMTESLERLNQIVLSKDEQSRILRFDGDVSRLADAESFIYKLLKAFPSAFTRFHAMLFKLTFDSEISQLRESMKAMESGCKELRNGGVFVKLLEAILKAGNRMNAGTARGDAAAFNLNSLKKLADVKSVDGMSTLLHFVVEEVIRSEGKRRVLNRNQNPGQSKKERDKASSEQSKEEREKEYTVLGLSVVRALSVEFSNVKKSASIDLNSLSATASSLSFRLIGYQREMPGFIAGAEKELEFTRKTEMETLDLVKKTTEYYGLKDDGGINRLQIFVVVKDFLAMVDKVCAEIARNLHQKKVVPRPTASMSNNTTQISTPVVAAVPPAKFINLPAHFMSGNNTSDDSDMEF